MHFHTYPQGIWPKKISIPPTYPIHQTHFIQVATCLCEYTEEVSNKNSNNRIQQEAHSSLECSDIRKDRPGKTIDKQQVISHYIVNENNNNIASSGRFFHQDKGVGDWTALLTTPHPHQEEASQCTSSADCSPRATTPTSSS